MSIRILILGTGSMASKHAEMFQAHPDAAIVAAVDIDEARLSAFAARHEIAETFATLDDAIAWGRFDAAANVTPDAVHHATTLQLIAAGKHVFCEKPLAENFVDATEMVEAAQRAGVINMVNLVYRTLPEIDRAAQIVAEGGIGEVRHIEARYLQSWLVGNHWGDWATEPRWLWRLSSGHGSKGALGDIGIHILDSATFIAGIEPRSVHCRLATFPKAEDNRIGPYELDANDSFVMSLAFDGGVIGTVQASRFATGYANANKISVFGTHGGVEVRLEQEAASLRICAEEDVHTQTWRMIECPGVPTTYERFVDAVLSGDNSQPDFTRAAAMQRLIDLGFRSDAEGKTFPV